MQPTEVWLDEIHQRNGARRIHFGDLDEGKQGRSAVSSYQIFKSFFPREKLLPIREHLLKMHESRVKVSSRSGFTLTYETWLFDFLSPLVSLAEDHFDGGARLMPHWSSCQLVEPGAGLEFPPHQDVAALEVKTEADRGCVFWLPLDDVTPHMPTLAVCRELNLGLLPHVDDGRGLSIIDARAVKPGWAWKVLSDARIGDVVRLDALCVHRTHVPHDCRDARLSLDVRARPL